MRVVDSLLVVALATAGFLAALTHTDTSWASGPGDECSPCKPDNARLIARKDEFVEKCDGGDSDACHAVATMLFGPPWCCVAGHDQDRVRAQLLFEKSCHLGHEPGCRDAALNVDPWAGRGGRKLAEQACQAGAGHACYRHADALAWANTKECPYPDADAFAACLRHGHEPAIPFYEKSCELGDPSGCAFFAIWGLLGRDDQRARHLLEQSCGQHRAGRLPEISTPLACAWLAEYYYATGVAGPRNLTGARELIHELCRTDNFGCEKRFLLDRFLRDWARWLVWGLEALLLLGAPLVLVRRVRRAVRSRWISVSAATLATIAAVLASVQVAYFAWGTTFQSVFWMGAGLPWLWIAWMLVRQARSPGGADSQRSPS